MAYTGIIWGLDRTTSSYVVGLNLSGTWYEVGTTSSGGSGLKTHIYDPAFQPAATFGSSGVGNGSSYQQIVRTGGAAQYGLDLINYTVTDEIAAGEFDCARANWATATNMATGGNLFSGWDGSNTPSQGLAQTWGTYGQVTGRAINAGNRWGALSLATRITGGAKSTVGLQIGPDVVPSSDGTDQYDIEDITIASPAVLTLTAHGFEEGQGVKFTAGTPPGGFALNTTYYVLAAGLTANEFQLAATIGGTAINSSGAFTADLKITPSWAGSFAITTNASIWGHKWTVAWSINKNTVRKGGWGFYHYGSSASAALPAAWGIVDDYWTTGLDMSGATFTNTIAIKIPAATSVYFGTSARVSGTGTAGITITTGDATDSGRLSGDDGADVAVQWKSNGSAALLGLFGATPVVQPATTGETVGFTAGAGTAVLDDSTFTGNVGATAYRISDIVKALKNLGVLAA